MSSIYKRGSRLYCRVKELSGKWSAERTPFVVGEEAKAVKYAADLQKGIDKTGAPDSMTVRAYLERWSKERESRVACATVDLNRLERHAMPHIGELLMGEVTPRHIRDLVRALRATTMAPRSQLHIFRCLHTMFESAEVDGVVTSNPVKVKPGELPKKVDQDPEWRSLATFAVGEVVRLISDPLVAPERRVAYALKAIAGLRHGEAAALCFRHIEPAEPLDRLKVEVAYCSRTKRIKSTKTGDTRAVPVHPTLAAILASWRETGWEQAYGRKPTADDFVVPSHHMTPSVAGDAGKAFGRDLARLGLRREAGALRDRGGHDLRSWYKTRTIEDGADSLIIQRTTHAPPRGVDSGYQRFSWATVCREVGKLQISIVEGGAVELVTTHRTKIESSTGKGAEAHGNRNRFATRKRASNVVVSDEEWRGRVGADALLRPGPVTSRVTGAIAAALYDFVAPFTKAKAYAIADEIELRALGKR